LENFRNVGKKNLRLLSFRKLLFSENFVSKKFILKAERVQESVESLQDNSNKNESRISTQDEIDEISFSSEGHSIDVRDEVAVDSTEEKATTTFPGTLTKLAPNSGEIGGGDDGNMGTRLIDRFYIGPLRRRNYEEDEFEPNWRNCKLKCCHPKCIRNVERCAFKKSICSKIESLLY
jgi:hypothetical protein